MITYIFKNIGSGTVTLFSPSGVNLDFNLLLVMLFTIIAIIIVNGRNSVVLQETVQITPSGKLIVLKRDCQVTGGYLRILQISETSLNKLSQKTTNQSIIFK